MWLIKRKLSQPMLYSYNLSSYLIHSLNTHLANLISLFFRRTRELNHKKYVEIKQFSKVYIKQNNIPTAILLIKFLFYQ